MKKLIYILILLFSLLLVNCDDSNKPWHSYKVTYENGSCDTIKAQSFKYYFEDRAVYFIPAMGAVRNVENVVCIDKE